MHVKVLALPSALLLAGCVSAADDADYPPSAGCPAGQKAAAAEAAAPDDDDAAGDERDPTMFAARSGGVANILVKVDGKYITGPNVSLGRYVERGAHALRGVAYGTVIDLRIDGEHVRGALGNEPVNLRVLRRGDSIDVAGLVPGRVSRFHIDEEGMRGTIGWCSYDLVRAGAGFSGRRSCGGSMSNFILELPDTMASWTDADIASVLAIFLRAA